MAGASAKPSSPVRSEPVGLRLERLMPFVLALIAASVYLNTLPNEFVFDTTQYIEQLDEADSPWEIVGWLRPMSRPAAQATMVLNYVVDGDEPRGYHLINIAIHAASAVVLFLLVRRLVAAWRRRDGEGMPGENAERSQPSAVGIAAAVALLWSVHPLCTQAVSYVIQRHESMMAMWFLVSLWALAAAAVARGRGVIAGYGVVAVAAAFLAVSSKQVAVGLPIVAYLMDRTFFARTWGGPLRHRWPIYVGLLASAAYLLIAGGGGVAQGEDALTGVGAGGVAGAVGYLLSQGEVILAYLRLVVLPWPQVFDWGAAWRPAWPNAKTTALVTCAVVGALLAIATFGVIRRRWWGWVGFSCFVIMGPTSSVVPITDYYFEHRIYLPLAGLVGLLVVAGSALIYRAAQPVAAKIAATGLVIAIGVILATLTVLRNVEYRTPASIWQTVTERVPTNPRGWYNLGLALEDQLEITPDDPNLLSRIEQAYRRSHQIRPWHVLTAMNLGALYSRYGRDAEALPLLKKAAELEPETAVHHHNLGEAYRRLGRPEEAAGSFRRALEVDPNRADTYSNLAVVEFQAGQHDEAVALTEQALEIEPDNALAHQNLGRFLVDLGRWQQAGAALQSASAAYPDEPRLRLLQARLLAASPIDQQRDGRQALEILRKLADDGYPPDPIWLEHVSLALAELGDYRAAASAVNEAIARARQTNLPLGVIAELERRATLFDGNRPYRLTPIAETASPAIEPHETQPSGPPRNQAG
ncbi:MAG: tetratricopeptide repeat protein [Planctomycetota bacterium]